MSEKPKAQVVLRDFPGLATRPDQTDLPPGAAAIQINLMSTREGAIQTRPGYQPVIFEEE